MIIDKLRVDGSLRKVRGLYREHAEGKLSPSIFVTQARRELNVLYLEHTLGLIEATASRFTEELVSFQAQFGLDLEYEKPRLIQVTRGYRGIRASVYIRSKVYVYSSGGVEVFIGPFDEWDKVAVRTVQERDSGSHPSFYTKRRRNRWQDVRDFDFPELLQRIKEDSERPEPEYEGEDIAF